jgi:hypothetical protein
MIARPAVARWPYDVPGAGMDAVACFVHAHHPDRLRAPAPRPGRVGADRMRAALAWNVFRTLAPIDPSRWLRPLHARVFGFDQRYRAPQWLDVRLWTSVRAPRASEAGCIDVVCDSGEAIWAFLTTFDRDVIVTDADAAVDPIARTAAAAARLAGRRRCFVGLLSSGPASAPIGERLTRHYAAAPARLRERLPADLAGVDIGGIGAGTWAACATVLAGCAASPAVGDPERVAARRCLRWMAACGIVPDAPVP